MQYVFHVDTFDLVIVPDWRGIPFLDIHLTSHASMNIGYFATTGV